MGRRDRGIGLENAPWLYGKFLIPFFFGILELERPQICGVFFTSAPQLFPFSPVPRPICKEGNPKRK